MPKKQIPIYRPILKKAWAITKQNKFLWVFGLFAALAGNGGVYEVLIRGFGRVTARGGALFLREGWFWPWSFFNLTRLKEISRENPLFLNFFWLTVFIILIALGIIIWLSIASRGALINSVGKIASRQKTNLKEGWAAGNHYFWPVLGLNALARALIFCLLFLITIPVMFFITGGSGSFGWNLFLYIVSFILFSVLALFVAFMAIYASCFVVIKDLPFLEAIKNSWRLFIGNWLVSAEVALILALIVLGAGIGLILFSILYFIPIALLLIAFAYLELTIGFWLIIFLSILGWLAAVFLVGALLSSFQFSTWTLLFLELNKKRVFSKLLRFVGLHRT